MTRWFVHGAKCICVGDVVLDEVLFVVVGVGVIVSTLVPIYFANFFKASLWSP